ncbi:retrovirus-related pol polyprotein from transposon TNT 1-94 [Tanacetum coccineum]
MIAPRVRDVYVLDMTSSAQESCFFAKAFENLNWLWHKRLAHLNFKTINKLAKQNLVIGLPSLVYSKNKPCSSCEKGKHHKVETDIRQKDKKSSQNDKTEHGMEEHEKSQSQSQTREVKVKADAENEEILNGPTHLGLQDEWKAEINFAILLTLKVHLSKPLSEEAHMKTKT